ncbi:MAG: hypothetical protein ABIG37_00025 [Nanoarchaeota archaeon]|nr:hypothetical protein [Nanoarchaeota archaeon]
MVKAEDVVFWILILAVIGIVIWLAFGSPGFETSLFMIALFVATSEILLWRNLFAIDKQTAVGFEKIRSKLVKIESSLKRIETKLKIK